MQEMRETGVPALRERFAEEAAALGVTLEEVVASNKAKRGRPRKPRNEGEEVEAARLSGGESATQRARGRPSRAPPHRAVTHWCPRRRFDS